MKRLSFVIGFTLLLAGGANLVLAQHGGGGHSGGGHSGGGTVGGGHSGGGGHSAISSTPSTLSSRSPSAGELIYPTPIGLQQQFSGYTGINRGALPVGPYRNGYGAGYGRRGYYGGYYLPYYLSTFDDYDSYGSYPTAQGESSQTDGVTANLLGGQIAQLSAEVEALREERQYGGAPVAARGPYNAPPAAAEDETPSAPPVTLVLQDGKQVQLRSYAVMGQDIWDFSVQPAKRIAISSINVAASKTVTESNGGEFPELH